MWQTLHNGVSIGRSSRTRTYRRVATSFPYQSLGQPGGRVKPGEWVIYRQDNTTYLARYMARVTAPRESADVPMFRGLAVLALSPEGTGAYERWIEPKDVVRVIGDWARVVLTVGTVTDTVWAHPLPETLER